MSEGKFVLVIQEGVATLTINRPEKLNAIDGAMLVELTAHCDRIERDNTVRVVIITGAGDKAFSAGGDIAAWSGLSPMEFARHWVRPGHDAFDRLARLRQPVIAVLNGHTLGGGVELAALADVRVAEEHVRFGQPEPGLGIIPGWSGTQRAVQRFGARMVRRMALFGEMFSGREALEHGLVDHVTAKGAGLAFARELADRVLARAPLATELTKTLINIAAGEERGGAVEALAGAIAVASPELNEGLAAFAAKRRPDFNTDNGDDR